MLMCPSMSIFWMVWKRRGSGVARESAQTFPVLELSIHRPRSRTLRPCLPPARPCPSPSTWAGCSTRRARGSAWSWSSSLELGYPIVSFHKKYLCHADPVWQRSWSAFPSKFRQEDRKLVLGWCHQWPPPYLQALLQFPTCRPSSHSARLRTVARQT